MSAPVTHGLRRGLAGVMGNLGIRGWAIVALSVLVLGAIVIARLTGGVSTDETGAGGKTAPLPHDGDAKTGSNVAPETMDAPQGAVAAARSFAIDLTRQSPYTNDRLMGSPSGYASSPTRAVITVPTDQRDFVLTCLLIENEWRVDSFDVVDKAKT